MNEFDLSSETECNPDCVYVPAQGWWCHRCGVFRDLDDSDLCADCRADAVPPVAATHAPRRRLRR
jgi:hypothetical protein